MTSTMRKLLLTPLLSLTVLATTCAGDQSSVDALGPDTGVGDGIGMENTYGGDENGYENIAPDGPTGGEDGILGDPFDPDALAGDDYFVTNPDLPDDAFDNDGDPSIDDDYFDDGSSGYSGYNDGSGGAQGAESTYGGWHDDDWGSGDWGSAGEWAGGADGQVVDIDPDDLVLTTRLVRFDSCSTLLDYIHDEYGSRVGPWGFNEGGFGIWPIFARGEVGILMVDEAVSAVPDSDSGAVPQPLPSTTPSNDGGADAGSSSSSPNFSGTNVQEQGADEPDIVKTDGKRIVVVSEGELVVVDVATQKETGRVSLSEGWAAEAFLHGDSVLVIQQAGGEVGIWGDHILVEDAPRFDGITTVIERVEISGGVPRVVDTSYIEGEYLSARSIGGTAHVVTQFNPQHRFPFVYPQSAAGEAAAERANRAAVLNSTLADWLPRMSGDGGKTWKQFADCDSVHAPSEFSGFGMTTVYSTPVDGAFSDDTTSVMAPGGIVYASTTGLYTATQRWLDPIVYDSASEVSSQMRDAVTNLHRFDLTSGTAKYTASGSVPGEVRNQFSLSEHAGHLRVVTTTGGQWWFGDRSKSESQVRVLREQGGSLVQVGVVGNIGKGEAVQSARFVGDIAYVVTFRQIDPFYTVDLSDPTKPVVRGELKIPGFSSYLHPISDDFVLGVGSDADLDGRITGAKVSLFDVSNLDNPLEVAVWTAPSGWTDIGWDHRAFLWWAPENLAVLPVSVYGEKREDNWAGAVLLRVANGAITEVGRLDHLDDSPKGLTDCRTLGPSDLPSRDPGTFSTNIEYQLNDGYVTVLACKPGDNVGMNGFDCSAAADYQVDDARKIGLSLGSNEMLTICWPFGGLQEIVRSIAIDDALWTLSYLWGDTGGDREAQFKVNDFKTLKELVHIKL